MKKCIMFMLLIVFLCGCGKDYITVGPERKEQEEKADRYNDNFEDEVLWSEKVPEKIIIPFNTTEETVVGEWNNERLAKVFAAVGSEMYFCQWEKEDKKAALYKIEIGQTKLQEVDIDIPEGMNIYAMTSDVYNNLHILLRTKVSSNDEVKSIIRTLDDEGNFIGDLDISEAIQGEISLHQAFEADTKGNFYITGLWDTMGIDSDGNRMWMIENRMLGIGDTYTAVLGVDEKLYMPYEKEDTLYLGKFDTINGDLETEYSLSDMDSNDRILAMGLDRDGGLVLYSNVSGIWRWNADIDSMSHLRELSETNLPENEYILIRAFLADGRLLLTKNVDDDGRIYQYIPISNQVE